MPRRLCSFEPSNRSLQSGIVAGKITPRWRNILLRSFLRINYSQARDLPCPLNLWPLPVPTKRRVFPLTAGAKIAIGRGEKSHTRLVDAAVSRVHCEVLFDKNRAIVTDAQSASGTFVNGQRIAAGELRAGDVIQIGNTQLRFKQDVAEDATISADASARQAAGQSRGRAAEPRQGDARASTGRGAPRERSGLRQENGRTRVAQATQGLCDLAGKASAATSSSACLASARSASSSRRKTARTRKSSR